MKLKYIPVFAENMETQINFYTQKLGFKQVGHISLVDDSPGAVIQAKNLDVALVVTETDKADYKSCIVLSTDDCIKDYRLYKTLGVFFCVAPRYLPTGLTAEFLDPAGNRFILFEERNYTEI
ncbi:MAG TPA: VOC family protein [Mucilaginibacter sp.]